MLPLLHLFFYKQLQRCARQFYSGLAQARVQVGLCVGRGELLHHQGPLRRHRLPHQEGSPSTTPHRLPRHLLLLPSPEAASEEDSGRGRSLHPPRLLEARHRCCHPPRGAPGTSNIVEKAHRFSAAAIAPSSSVHHYQDGIKGLFPLKSSSLFVQGGCFHRQLLLGGRLCHYHSSHHILVGPLCVVSRVMHIAFQIKEKVLCNQV